MKKLVFLCFTLLFVSSSYSQNIKGVVFNEETRIPIIGVIVFLEQDSLIVFSDKNGAFDMPYKGEYPVTFSVEHEFYDKKLLQLGKPVKKLQFGMFFNGVDTAKVLEKDSFFEYAECDNLDGYSCLRYRIHEHIQKQFEYPEIAKQMQQSDLVTVTFKLSINGDVEVLDVVGNYNELNDEAMRLIKTLSFGSPLIYNGFSVNCILKVPIDFNIQ